MIIPEIVLDFSVVYILEIDITFQVGIIRWNTRMINEEEIQYFVIYCVFLPPRIGWKTTR